MEEWKDIEGFENYQISSEGNARNAKNKKNLISSLMKNGYLRVTLYKKRKPYYKNIHKLVADAFIPNPDNKPCVGHKDCNKNNNRVDNLYWCTYKENNNHPITKKRRSETKKGQIPKANPPKQVFQYTLDGELVAIWPSTMECKKNGFNRANISACCRGERKIHMGYKWSYKPL